jgi:type 1 fimbria pilin
MKIAKTITSILLFTSALMTTFSPAFADDPKASDSKVTIEGTVGTGGSGCPEGSASATVSPDGQEISILFDKFIADATKPKESRKSCNLAIPVKVPAGLQVSLYTADYRGYVSPDTTGKLNVEYFFAGQKGPKYAKTLKGETDYNETQELLASSFSACGDSVNMRINASMAATGKGIASVDSLDLAHQKTVASIPAHLIYHLKYQTCPAK